MKPLLLICFFFLCLCAQSQKIKDVATLKIRLDSLNRSIDRAVVKKDTVALKRLCADDFYFSHAAGRVHNKASWLRSVGSPDNTTASQEHDSVEVELHGNVAIMEGTLTVRFPLNFRPAYTVWYIRVYALRGKEWQLLSHKSLEESLL